MVGRPRNAVLLTENERAALQSWTRSRSCSQARALRARIVLTCEDEPTNTGVADAPRHLPRHGGQVARPLPRRTARGPGRATPSRAASLADDDTVAHVLVRTLTPPPPGAGQAWSTRSMAAETGLSQSTVSRIWRAYRIQPGAGATAGQRRAWSLPDRADEVLGLFIAPPVCVLAVTARTGRGGGVRTSAGAAAARFCGQDRDVPHVLAVACAFAALRGRRHTEDAPRADHPALSTFLERVGPAARPGEWCTCWRTACREDRGATEPPGAAAPPRPRWHHVPGPAAWADEARRLFATDAQLPREAAPGVPRLRDALLTWSTTWTPSAAPFTRIAAPRPAYDTPAICGPDNDSNTQDVYASGHAAVPGATRITSPEAPPGAPVMTDPVVGLLREAVLAGRHRAGDRVRETPLASRLGLSRRAVRAGLRALAEEGMLDLLPSGATAVPAVTAKDVLDLYALRASLGALLIRRVAMLGPDHLAPASAALAEVRDAARDGDHARVREVDLWFQDALARTADLPQAARTFERLTARLRMFVTVLDMDYSQACDTITDEDAAVYDALCKADGNEAARLWRAKIERCVRFMIAQLPEDDAAPHLWTTLAGRPRLRRDDPWDAAH